MIRQFGGDGQVSGFGVSPFVVSLIKYGAVLLLCLAVFAGSGSFVGTSTVSMIKSAPSTPVRQPTPPAQISVPDTPVMAATEIAPAQTAELDPSGIGPQTELEAVGLDPALGTDASAQPVERARATSGVNIRAEPVSGSAKVGLLRRGDEVEVLGRSGGWVQIAKDSVVLGWVWGTYLGGSLAPEGVEVVELGSQVVAEGKSSSPRRSSVVIIDNSTNNASSSLSPEAPSSLTSN